MTTWDTGRGTPGKARATRAQVLAQAHTVVEDGKEVIRIRVWMEERVDTWRKVGVGRDDTWQKDD